MSDGEPSSIKRLTRCAARAPALSKGYEDRVEARFDFAVYGTRFAAHLCFDRRLSAKPKKPKGKGRRSNWKITDKEEEILTDFI